MAQAQMTEDEIIRYLQKSTMPSLLVEGTDDAKVYRWLESKLDVRPGSVLPCGGKNTLIAIFKRRNEIPNTKLVWLADSDMWLFTQPPHDTQGIIFTKGYSIENDIYAGSAIENLLSGDEIVRHYNMIHSICKWFAFEISEFRKGNDAETGFHFSKIIDESSLAIRPEFAIQRGYIEPTISQHEEVLSNYKLLLRGKTLIDILAYFLSTAGREQKYSKGVIVDVALKLPPDNPYITRLVTDIRSHLV